MEYVRTLGPVKKSATGNNPEWVICYELWRSQMYAYIQMSTLFCGFNQLDDIYAYDV